MVGSKFVGFITIKKFIKKKELGVLNVLVFGQDATPLTKENLKNETAVGLHVYRKGPPICLHPPHVMGKT